MVDDKRDAQRIHLLDREVQGMVFPRPEAALHPVEHVPAAVPRCGLAGADPEAVDHGVTAVAIRCSAALDCGSESSTSAPAASASTRRSAAPAPPTSSETPGGRPARISLSTPAVAEGSAWWTTLTPTARAPV